jgi:epoxyqueuosine reductase
MAYMSRNSDKRMDPRLLLPGAKSIIVVALNYYPRKPLDDDQLQFAYYAYGKDYHDVMKKRMMDFAHSLGIRDIREKNDGVGYPFRGLICCDTVPMLDRYWAWKSGIGWIGRNTSLIIPHSGSFFFLGEIITDMETDSYDSPMETHCGSCRRCIDSCPTGALCQEFNVDARRCLSFLTIENKDAIPTEMASKMGRYVYGCDKCQLACPHNSFSTPTDIEELNPTDEFMSMQEDDWKNLSHDDYIRLFRGSAVKRAKYEGLTRNIESRETRDESRENHADGVKVE